MKYKFLITGPLTLEDIDNNDNLYLKLKFSDGFTRKLAKSGNWPSEFADNLYNKAKGLINQSVYIKTSQTTKNWDTKEWMCDLHLQSVAETREKIASELKIINNDSKQSFDKFILVSTAIGKSYFANLESVSDYFKSENEYLDFCHSFEKDFVSTWQAKNARNKLMPLGMKRVRISGLGNLTKRNGFRVVASEVLTENTSEAFKFFHILRIDEKLDKEEYLSNDEIKQLISLREQLEKKYPKAYVNWING